MIKVNYSDYEKVINWAVLNKKIVMVKGAPGIGKSQIVNRVISILNKKKNKFELIEERLYQRGAYANGLATIIKENNKEVTKWTISEWMQQIQDIQEQGKEAILLLDDFHLTIPQVMNVTYQLFENFRINAHKIKPITIFILGNFDLKSAEGFPVQSPIMGRLNGGFYELVPDVKSFSKFSLTSGRVHSSIVRFVTNEPKFLYDPDPESMVMTYSPRNYENLTKALKDHPLGVRIIPAYIGEEAGNKLLSQWDSLTITFDEIFNISDDLRTNIFKMNMLVGHIRSTILNYESKDFTKLIKQINEIIDKYLSLKHHPEIFSTFITELATLYDDPQMPVGFNIFNVLLENKTIKNDKLLQKQIEKICLLETKIYDMIN